jgi:hypothetical protein
MKTSFKIIIVLFLISVGFAPIKAKAEGGNDNSLPGLFKFMTQGDRKPATKKEKRKEKTKEKPGKADEDKMRRHKKPTEQNRSRRADQDPGYVPRTIIVV